jgi:hypothetical protein
VIAVWGVAQAFNSHFGQNRALDLRRSSVEGTLVLVRFPVEKSDRQTDPRIIEESDYRLFLRAFDNDDVVNGARNRQTEH